MESNRRPIARFAIILSIVASVGVALGFSSQTSTAQQEVRPRPQQPGRQDPQRRTQDNGEAQINVPQHPWDIVLGRPTATGLTFSVMAYSTCEAKLKIEGEGMNTETTIRSLKSGEPLEFEVNGLNADSAYRYTFFTRISKAEEFKASANGRFHTARKAGAEFSFAVQADSHLDYNTTPELYRRTLTNMLAANPDFLIDLGDTFMTDKYSRYEDSAGQYLAQRYYFGLLGASIPVFLTLGNHDGEQGRFATGSIENMAVWSAGIRNRYFPNPAPDGFYSGNQREVTGVGKLKDYYSWTWGDALFIVLDPFWYTRERGGDDSWARTLGEEQYNWLRQVLSSSSARFKFVFIHHLVGGADRSVRGGIAAAPFFEWGGKELDGRDTFAEHRKGWEAPIHKLLVKHKVSAVFHGHDHLYAKEDLDGIVYQEVPQPGLARYQIPRNAAEYGYTTGEIQGSSGFIKVSVGQSFAKVVYIRSFLPSDENSGRQNGQVGYSYIIK